MKEKNWLSEHDSLIEPPPKRGWYGKQTEDTELRQAYTYAEFLKIARRNIDEKYAGVFMLLFLVMIASIAGMALYWARKVGSCWSVVAATPLAIAVSGAFYWAVLDLWARGYAFLTLFFDRRYIGKSKPSFKKTFKFGKQNGSK